MPLSLAGSCHACYGWVMTVDYEETVAEEDLESRVLGAVTEDHPYVLVILTDMGTDGFGIRCVVGGGIPDMETTKSLLRKAYNAFPGEDEL
jgi:hypothetical protein